jgi:hypothetical protein
MLLAFCAQGRAGLEIKGWRSNVGDQGWKNKNARGPLRTHERVYDHLRVDLTNYKSPITNWRFRRSRAITATLHVRDFLIRVHPRLIRGKVFSSISAITRDDGDLGDAAIPPHTLHPSPALRKTTLPPPEQLQAFVPPAPLPAPYPILRVQCCLG